MDGCIKTQEVLQQTQSGAKMGIETKHYVECLNHKITVVSHCEEAMSVVLVHVHIHHFQ